MFKKSNILLIILLSLLIFSNVSLAQNLDQNNISVFTEKMKQPLFNIYDLNDKNSFDLTDNFLYLMCRIACRDDINVSAEIKCDTIIADAIKKDKLSEYILNRAKTLFNSIIKLDDEKKEKLLSNLSQYIIALKESVPNSAYLNNYSIVCLNSIALKVLAEKEFKQISLFLEPLKSLTTNYSSDIHKISDNDKIILVKILNYQAYVLVEYTHNLTQSRKSIPDHINSKATQFEKLVKMDEKLGNILKSDKENKVELIVKENNRSYLEMVVDKYNQKEPDKIKVINEKAIDLLIEKKYMKKEEKKNILNTVIEPMHTK